MSFRKNWLPNLVTTFLLAPLVFKPVWQPWIEALFNQPRDRLLRALGYSIGVSVITFAVLRARTLWSWVRARRLRNRVTVLPLSGSSISMTIGKAAITASVSPPDLPPGTASANAMAMQDPPPRPQMPQFVNNSHWAQWEAAQRQHAMPVHFATTSTKPGFRPALLSPPSAPTSLVLH